MSDHVSGNDPGRGRHVVTDYGSAFFVVRDWMFWDEGLRSICETCMS